MDWVFVSSYQMKSFALTMVLIAWGLAPAISQDLGGLERLLEEEQFERLVALADSLIEIGDDVSPRVYQYKGDGYFYLNDKRNALLSYSKALEAYRNSDLNDPDIEMDCLSNIGECYSELGINDKAQAFHQQHLVLARAHNDTTHIATATYNCAVSLIGMGQFNEAMPLLQAVYNIDAAARDSAALGFDLNALGYVHIEAGFTEKAVDYYRQSITLLKQSGGNRGSLGTRFNNLGKAFLEQGDLDSAEFYLKASFSVHNELHDTINASERLINLGRLENKKGNFDGAISLLSRAESYLSKKGAVDQLVACRLELALSYDALGASEKAEGLLMAAAVTSKKKANWSDCSKAYVLLAKKYERDGLWQKALAANKSAQIYNDSLKNKETNRSLVEMQVRYEVDNMLHENELLKVETALSTAELKIARRERLALWIGIVVLIMASAVSLLVLIQRQKLRKKLYIREVENLKLQVNALIGKADGTSGEVTMELLNSKLDNPLSDREFEILASALKGNNNTQIAEQLFVSVNTVKFHLKNVYDKLGVSSRNEALQFVIRQR
jgi:tetratricopeptide (TPR) repeat protein